MDRSILGMGWRSASTLFVLGLFGGISSLPCSAQLTFCNHSGISAQAVVGYPVGESWFTRGWYSLKPFSCATVVGGNLTNRYYYIYAHSDGGSKSWGGNTSLCTISSAFTLRQENCPPGADMRGFAQIDIGNSKSHTHTISCDSCFERQGDGSLLYSSPTISQSFTLGSHTMNMPLKAAVRITDNMESVRATVTAIADLSDLQRVLPAVIRESYDHDDDCNYKLRLHTISLDPHGWNSASLSVAGHYESWWCGPFGTKGRSFEQNGSARATITPFASQNAVGASVSLTDVQADGLLGGFLGNDLIGGWLQRQIQDLVPKVIEFGDINRLLPPELRDGSVLLLSAAFENWNENQLQLRVSAEVRVSGAKAMSIFNQIGR